jgi:hypothetical protein
MQACAGLRSCPLGFVATLRLPRQTPAGRSRPGAPARTTVALHQGAPASAPEPCTFAHVSGTPISADPEQYAASEPTGDETSKAHPTDVTTEVIGKINRASRSSPPSARRQSWFEAEPWASVHRSSRRRPSADPRASITHDRVGSGAPMQRWAIAGPLVSCRFRRAAGQASG